MKLSRLLFCVCAMAMSSACAAQAAIERGLPSSSAIRFLTAENTVDDWPCFSPDGRSILFSRSVDEGKSWDLFVVPVSGGRARRFVQSPLPLPVAATRASWSRYGSTIAFTGVSPQGTGTLWLIDALGVNAYPAKSVTGLDQIYYPSWMS